MIQELQILEFKKMAIELGWVAHRYTPVFLALGRHSLADPQDLMVSQPSLFVEL